MTNHTVRSIVRGVFVAATFVSTSQALAHETVPYPSPRDIQHDDVVEWKADVVGVRVETTKSDVTVTTTLPENLPYFYAIEILLFCSDGSTAHLPMEEGWVVESGARVTRSCENGATIDAAGVTIYAQNDHADEEQPGEDTAEDPSGEDSGEEDPSSEP